MPDRHPLLDHQHDVAACFLELMKTRGLRRAAERAAGAPLGAMQLQRLAVLVFLHDAGKANAGFQAKQFSGSVPRGWPAFTAGHSAEARTEEAEALYAKHLPCEALLEWGEGDCADRLLLASVSHHGRPVARASRARTSRVIWEDVLIDGHLVYSPAATLARMGRAVTKHFPEAFTSGGAPLPGSAAFGHWFAGAVQLADWLGSDTQFFDYSHSGEERAKTAPPLAERAVRSIGLNTENWRGRVSARGLTFSQAFGADKNPRPFQSELSGNLEAPLVILESETGSGKTEAVLWRFLHLFKTGAVDSMYFALPTRAAASQLYERILQFTRNVWDEVDRPTTVRALAGYQAADGHEIKARLPDFKVLWADHVKDQKAHLRWAAEGSKRFLAAPIAVGTIDQAMLAALQVRHAHLRHALLSRSLLVIDEVHASDAYMGTVSEHLLRSHLHSGGHAILLSATLGGVARARYQATLGTRNKQVAVPSLEAARAVAYPSISLGAGPARAIMGAQGCKIVQWRTQAIIEAPEVLAAIALDAAARGARVLLVRNTVPNAIKIYHAVQVLAASRGVTAPLLTVKNASTGQSVPTLHHSRFSKQCRPRLDAAVEKQIGKQREGVKGRIVIGTQTLEQSLDLDADYLISDLCPMDVLLQRIGRLHRHARPEIERPNEYRQPKALILTPTREAWPGYLQRQRNGLGRMHDGGGVYPDLRILEATWQLVDAAPQCEIPRENRRLVEEATHPDALNAIVRNGGAVWEAHRNGIEGSSGSERSLGHLHALDFDHAFDDQFPFADADEKISTRLGLADRLVEFDVPVAGPFGPVKQIALRFHLLAKDLALDARPQLMGASATGFTFRLGEQTYAYTRTGVELLRQTGTGGAT